MFILDRGENISITDALQNSSCLSSTSSLRWPPARWSSPAVSVYIRETHTSVTNTIFQQPTAVIPRSRPKATPTASTLAAPSRVTSPLMSPSAVTFPSAVSRRLLVALPVPRVPTSAPSPLLYSPASARSSTSRVSPP